MNKAHSILILTVCTSLAACAGAPAPAPTTPVPSIVVSEEYGVPADAQIIGYVKGVSCAHSPLPDAASKDAAIADLTRKAASQGATGVAHLRNHVRGISASCVYSQVAEGLAYRQP